MKVNSNGHMPDGTWNLGPMQGNSPSEKTSYGGVGFIPLTDQTVGPDGRGLGIHSGRDDDYEHDTYGCVRTTDAAMQFLNDHPPVMLEVNPPASGGGHPAGGQHSPIHQ